MIENVYNFDEPATRRFVQEHFRSLRGKWRVTEVQYRERRSDAQNRLYWSCYIMPLVEPFSESQGRDCDKDFVHGVMKDTFLTRSVADDNGEPMVNPMTGKELKCVLSTTDLDIEKFSNYLNDIGDLMERMFDMQPKQIAEQLGMQEEWEAVHGQTTQRQRV